jgi:BON domain
MSEPRDEEPRDYREERVRAALASDPRVHEPELTVDILGGTVLVRGVVPTEERRRAVELVVRDACPELALDNQTRVGEYPEPPGAERIE